MALNHCSNNIAGFCGPVGLVSWHLFFFPQGFVPETLSQQENTSFPPCSCRSPLRNNRPALFHPVFPWAFLASVKVLKRVPGNTNQLPVYAPYDTTRGTLVEDKVRCSSRSAGSPTSKAQPEETITINHIANITQRPVRLVPSHGTFCFFCVFGQICIINGRRAVFQTLISCCFNGDPDGLRCTTGIPELLELMTS